MIVSNAKNVVGINYGDSNKVLKKVLVSPEQGWKDNVMRLFELSPGNDSCSLRHSHEWAHVVYIVGGTGLIHLDGTDYPVEAGSFAYIPGGKIHQLVNKGEDLFSFICIVPPERDI